MTASTIQNPRADRYPSVARAAAAIETTSITRSACTRSAMRLARGAETSRTQVPAASASPISSGDKPRSLKNAGKNGEATP